MEKTFFAAKSKNDDIRMNSSSGGIFYELANYIIQEDGVVYGAIYDKENNIVHSRATTQEELKGFFGSKYAQSNIGNCYKKAKKDLENGKMVLFSGTPCQVNALKTITKNMNCDKLYLVDIICHGTPQTKYFNDYKMYLEKKYKSKIKKINMRYKDKKKYLKNKKKSHISIGPVESHVIEVEFENGKRFVEDAEFNYYYQFFDFFINASCFNCPFANLNRISDLTIGDFHEFSSKLESFNDGNGVSLVIVNTKKGNILKQKVINDIEMMKKKEEECYQPAICKEATKPRGYDAFSNDYEKYGFEYILKKYTEKSVKYNLKRFLYKIKLYDKVLKLKYKFLR